jgi:hypothetical protein
MGDDSVRAAWRVYIANESREDLEDTLLRIVHNGDEEEEEEEEEEDDDDDEEERSASEHTEDVVHLLTELEENELLSAEDAATAKAMARLGNQVWCSF